MRKDVNRVIKKLIIWLVNNICVFNILKYIRASNSRTEPWWILYWMYIFICCMGSLYLCTSEGKKLVFYIYTAPGTLNEICLIHTFNIHQRRKKENEEQNSNMLILYIYIYTPSFVCIAFVVGCCWCSCYIAIFSAFILLNFFWSSFWSYFFAKIQNKTKNLFPCSTQTIKKRFFKRNFDVIIEINSIFSPFGNWLNLVTTAAPLIISLNFISLLQLTIQRMTASNCFLGREIFRCFFSLIFRHRVVSF